MNTRNTLKKFLAIALMFVMSLGFTAGVNAQDAPVSAGGGEIPADCLNNAELVNGVVNVTADRYHCATGKDGSVPFHFEVPEGRQLVIATYMAGCAEGGLFLGFPSGTTLDIVITDGMVQVAQPHNAARIFREQVDKSLRNDEAVGYVLPLDEWGLADMVDGEFVTDADITDLLTDCTPSQLSYLATDSGCLYGCDLDGDGVDDQVQNRGNDTGDNAASGQRQITGQGESLTFEAGTPVIGTDITLNDGTHFSQCYLENPNQGGSVNTGVLWPNAEEIAAATPC